jgi:hypothetical protein
MKTLHIHQNGIATTITVSHPTITRGRCSLQDIKDYFDTVDLDQFGTLRLVDTILDPGVLEFVIHRLVNLQSIRLARIQLSKEDWSVLLKALKERLTEFGMYHVAYDSKLINEALMDGSSVTHLSISDCRYNFSTLDLTKTKIQDLIIDHQIITHDVLVRLLTVPLLVLHLDSCDLTDVEGAVLASWLLWNNQIETLRLTGNRHITGQSRKLILEAINTHPRIKHCWTSAFMDTNRELSGLVSKRAKSNQSTRVKRMVPLLAQPPVPKDILRHIYLFLK